MPINVYTGLMGSGKTYECVSSVIVPALSKGRRVVSNIENLQIEAIREFVSKSYKMDLEDVGELLCVTNDEVKTASFYPDGTDKESVVSPGDIVCLDEAWQFYGATTKLLDNAMNFFRMHRHYVDPFTKVSCDIVLMVQSISDLHRSLKIVVEYTFVFTKLKTLGLNSCYRVDLWQGHKTPIKARVSWETKKYDKRVFKLYSSYAGGKGNEVSIDRRTNKFKSKKLWAYIFATILSFSIAATALNKFFGGKLTESDANLSDEAPKPSNANEPINPQFQTSVHPVTAGRLLGRIEVDGQITFLAEDSGFLQPISPSAVTGKGLATTAEVDGKRYLYNIYQKPKEHDQ